MKMTEKHYIHYQKQFRLQAVPTQSIHVHSHHDESSKQVRVRAALQFPEDVLPVPALTKVPLNGLGSHALLDIKEKGIHIICLHALFMHFNLLLRTHVVIFPT